jgi:hypothetical protein
MEAYNLFELTRLKNRGWKEKNSRSISQKNHLKNVKIRKKIPSGTVLPAARDPSTRQNRSLLSHPAHPSASGGVLSTKRSPSVRLCMASRQGHVLPCTTSGGQVSHQRSSGHVHRAATNVHASWTCGLAKLVVRAAFAPRVMERRSLLAEQCQMFCCSGEGVSTIVLYDPIDSCRRAHPQYCM